MNNFYRLSCLLCGALIGFSLWAQRSQMPIPGLPRPAVMQKKHVKKARPAAMRAPMRVVRPGSERLKVRLNAPENLLSSWNETVDGETKTGTVTYNANDLPVKIVYTNGDVDNFEYTMVDNRIWSKKVKTTTDSYGRTSVATDTRTLDEQNRLTHSDFVQWDGNYVETSDISYDHNPKGDLVYSSTHIVRSDGDDWFSFSQHTWFEPIKGYLFSTGNDDSRYCFEVCKDGMSYIEYADYKRETGWVRSYATHNFFDPFGERLSSYTVNYNNNGSIDWCDGDSTEIQLDVPKSGWVTIIRHEVSKGEDGNISFKPSEKEEMTYNVYNHSSCIQANGDRGSVRYTWNSEDGTWEREYGDFYEWVGDNIAKCSDGPDDDNAYYEKYDADGNDLYNIYYNADGSFMTRSFEYSYVDRYFYYHIYRYYTADSVLIKQLRTGEIRDRWTDFPSIEEYRDGTWTLASGEITINYSTDNYDRYILDEQSRVTEHSCWYGGRLDFKELIAYNANGYQLEVYQLPEGSDTNIYLCRKETLSVSGTVETFERLYMTEDGTIEGRNRSEYDTALQVKTYYRWNEELQCYEVSDYYVDPIVTTLADGTEVYIHRRMVDGQIVNDSKSETLRKDDYYMNASYSWDAANNRWVGYFKCEEISYPNPVFDYVKPAWPLQSLLCLPTDYDNFGGGYSYAENRNDFGTFGRNTRYDWDENINDWVVSYDDQDSAVVEGNKITIDGSNKWGIDDVPTVYKNIITRDDAHRLLSEKYYSDGEVITDEAYSYNSDDLVATYVDQRVGKSYEFFYVKATGIEPVALSKSGLLVNGRSLSSEDGAVLTVSDLSGRTLAKGASVTMNAAGVYLVTAGGKSYKVVVK